jgi:trehalose 6-phosphate synthase/phosphatase
MDRLIWKGGQRRLLVASNRLPIAIENIKGRKSMTSGAGGLVTALAPIIKNTGGVWVGWPGCELTGDVRKLLNDYKDENSIDLRAVSISPEEAKKYYRGFSNEAIWPLFHDLLGHCRFEFENWETYLDINRRFAEKIIEVVRPGDFIWIHDYQLLMVAHFLRQMNIRHPLAFFLHIPFPSYDLLRRLPWKSEIIRGLLENDLIGFQTLRDRRNFTRSAKELMPQLEVNAKARYSDIHFGLRSIKVGHFPISIDFDDFDHHARSIEVAREAKSLHEHCNAGSLILGVDRLDYTKGIPERFLAFERTLEKYPELVGKLSLLQLVVPSRSHLPAYRDLKEHLDGIVGRINGRFSRFGWQPIQYMYRAVTRTELLGFYRACEIGLLTPLRDGMNLVAKEYCASTVDGNGVLILSEFAGASEQLGKGAIMVNPYNQEETANSIHRAFIMDIKEREKRMRILRAEVKRNNIYKWVDWFLTAFSDQEAEEVMRAERPYDTLPADVKVAHKHLEPLSKKDS